MFNKLNVFILMLLPFASSIANAETGGLPEPVRVCSQRAKAKVFNAGQVVGAGSLLTGMSILVTPLAFLTIPVAFGGYYVFGGTAKSTLKILKQAQFCQGRKIRRLYERYAIAANQEAVSFQEFCIIIDKGNIDGSLCPLEIPRKADVIDFVTDRD